MSEIKVNKISPRTACGTTTLGDSGDTFTIPSGVTISNSGTASGFGSTGEVSWNTTVQTASTVTGVSGVGYFMNTSGNTITLNLPAGTAGSSIAVADYAGTFQNNNLTISPNGSQKIGGTNADVSLSTEGQSAYFVYIDDTQGWINVIDSTSNIRGNAFLVASGGTESTSGNCKIHTFTGPGTFTVSAASTPAAENEVSYLVVGGGGGSHSDNSGGGGAGGYRELKSPITPYTASPLDGYPSSPNRITVTATAFPITVGAGGAATPTPGASNGDGSPSIFSTIVGAGGGAGECQDADGRSGGSGGGGGARNGAAGSGNTPSTSPAQGQNGGAGAPPAGGGGGGGGAGAAGSSAPTGGGGNGGCGVASEITASPVQYAGGGGGGGGQPGGQAGGTGGFGGGGPGTSNSVGTNGTANTGGGAGGAGQGAPNGATGGSGIVVIRYKFQ